MTRTLANFAVFLCAVALAAPTLSLLAEQQSPALATRADRISSSNVIVVDGSPHEAPSPGSGLIVAIDPVTGEVRVPTADEAVDLSLAARLGGEIDDGADLHELRSGSGGTQLLLDSRYWVSEIASIGPDGKLSAAHTQGSLEAQALEALSKAPAAATDTPSNEEDPGDHEATKEVQQ